MILFYLKLFFDLYKTKVISTNIFNLKFEILFLVPILGVNLNVANLG